MSIKNQQEAQSERIYEEIPMRRLRTQVRDLLPSENPSDDELNMDDYYMIPDVAGIRPLAGLRPPTVPPPMPPTIRSSAVAELDQFRRDFRDNDVVTGFR